MFTKHQRVLPRRLVETFDTHVMIRRGHQKTAEYTKLNNNKAPTKQKYEQ